MNNEEMNNNQQMNNNQEAMVQQQVSNELNNIVIEKPKKKSKKWIFIVIILILLLLLILFIIKKMQERPKPNELTNVKENMSDNLKNFSYDSEITANAYGAVLNIDLKCKEDLTNKLGYCNVDSDLVTLEEYMDYENKIVYSKANAITDNNNGWTKSDNQNIATSSPILKTLDAIKINKKEEKENGTLYIGEVNAKSLSNMFEIVNKTTSNRINVGSLIKKKIPVTVFVNKENYVENVTFSLSIIGIKMDCKINYFDFNTTPSIVLPEELNEL